MLKLIEPFFKSRRYREKTSLGKNQLNKKLKNPLGSDVSVFFIAHVIPATVLAYHYCWAEK